MWFVVDHCCQQLIKSQKILYITFGNFKVCIDQKGLAIWSGLIQDCAWSVVV